MAKTIYNTRIAGRKEQKCVWSVGGLAGWFSPRLACKVSTSHNMRKRSQTAHAKIWIWASNNIKCSRDGLAKAAEELDHKSESLPPSWLRMVSPPPACGWSAASKTLSCDNNQRRLLQIQIRITRTRTTELNGVGTWTVSDWCFGTFRMILRIQADPDAHSNDIIYLKNVSILVIQFYTFRLK